IAHDEEYLIECFILLVRKLGHLPTRADMRMERAGNGLFPDPKTFERWGHKNERIGKVLAYCRSHAGYDDVVAILEPAWNPAIDATDQTQLKGESTFGFVYLVRGRAGEYKIGRSNHVSRRISQLSTAAAVAPSLVHEIKTDDPLGIEAYWHARFASK